MPTLVTDDQAADSHLPHTVEVDADSRAIRLYLWTYAARVNRINTCKLFWAFVFMPFVLPLSATVRGLGRLVRWADEKFGREEDYLSPTPVVEDTGPSRGERFVEGVSGFMAKWWFKLQPVLKWGGIIIGATITLAAIGVAVWAISTDLAAFLNAVLIVAAFMAGCMLLMAILGGAIHLLDKSQRVHGFFRLMGQLGRSVHHHTCANVRVKK